MKYLMLLAPLLLSACAAPILASAEPTVTASAKLAVTGEGNRQLLATVTPWTSTDIQQAVVTLYAVGNATALTSQSLAQADLTKTVTFANLKRNASYTIIATALTADGPDAGTDPDPIHDAVASTCTTSFSTGTDNVVTIAGGIKLKLADKVFSGATTGNTVAVTAGTVTHTGAESITVQ